MASASGKRRRSQDDGFAIAMGFARGVPPSGVWLEQEPPERIHRERELKDQVTERIERSDMLSLVPERAREHLVGCGERGPHEHARLQRARGYRGRSHDRR